jgi:small-conductance mechanosensitive channel
MPLTSQIRIWSQELLKALSSVVFSIINFLPQLLVAILSLIVGWIAAKILQRLSYLLLNLFKLDEAIGITSQDKETAYLKPPSELISLTVFWFIFFYFGIAPAADVVGLPLVRAKVNQIVTYLPTALAVIFILGAAYLIANLFRQLISSLLKPAGLSFSTALGWIGWLATVIFGIITAVASLNIEPLLVRQVAGFILGVSFIGLTLGLGLGLREHLAAAAVSLQLRTRLTKGDAVKLEQFDGTVENLTLETVDLKTSEGVVSVPNKLFIEKAFLKKAAKKAA